MRDLLNRIGITQPGYFSDSDTYVVDIANANDYSKVSTKLDKSNLVEEVEDSSISNVSVSNIMYESNEYSLNLIADFDSDTYKLVVHKL